MRKRYQHHDHSDRVAQFSSLAREPQKQGRLRVRPFREKRLKKGWLILIVLALVCVGILAYEGIAALSATNNILASNVSIKDLFSKSNLRQTDGVTNIMLLGKGGAKHSGGRLTDTMILMRVRGSDKKFSTVSFPRDLYVSIPGHGKAKINEAYADGYESTKVANKQVQAGADLLSKTIESVAGVPVHYVIAVDFDGFKSVVDTLGGVDVNVKNSFTDYEYPLSDCNEATGVGCEVTTARFTAGMQHMDGSRALIYARSRHSLDNGEGSDFARSTRQQNLIMAIRDKALSLGVLANPVKVSELFSTIGDHLKTNMSLSEIKDFTDVAKGIKKDETTSVVLDNSPTGLLESYSDGGYYLVPKGGSFSAIKTMVKNIFASSTDNYQISNITVNVLNGSGKTGLAKQLADELKSQGFTIGQIATDTAISKQSTIYDGTNSSSSLATIKNHFSNPKVEQFDSKGIIKVIIGQDYGK